MQPGCTTPGRVFVAAVLLAGALLASAGTAPPAYAQEGAAYPAGSYKPRLPWRVLQGDLRPWEMTRGVNTIQVSGGMVVSQTLPANSAACLPHQARPGHCAAVRRAKGGRRAPRAGVGPLSLPVGQDHPQG
jgi:hypothetical protein